MCCRTRTLFVGIIAAVAVATMIHGSQSPSNLGKQIAKLDIKDVAGKTWKIADPKDHKAVVVLFLGTQCPVNNAYMPRLAELHKAYADKGVLFLGINSNKQDTLAKIADHVKEFGIPFAVLSDSEQATADLFVPAAHTRGLCAGWRAARFATRAGSTIDLGPASSAPGQSRRPGQRLDEVLAGKQVSVATTEVAGCLIGRIARCRRPRRPSPTPNMLRRSCKIAARNAIAPGRSGRCRS